MEVMREVDFPKRYKAAGTDELSPYFKNAGEVLTSELINLSGSVWEREGIPKNYCETAIKPICNKGGKSLCKSHRRMNLLNILHPNCLLALCFTDYLPLGEGVYV